MLHRRFGAHRLHGEWFAQVPRLVELANARALTDPVTQRLVRDAYSSGWADGIDAAREQLVGHSLLNQIDWPATTTTRAEAA